MDISNRIASLVRSKEIDNKKAQFSRSYSMAFFDIDGNEVAKIDDFQAAFVDLLEEKFSLLTSEFQKPLEERFSEMYSNSEDADERYYRAIDELTLHSIQLPSDESDDWQLLYEMNSDDTIFHIEFEGWKYKLVGVTH
ncbi:MAG: hypothetical protein ACK4E0_15115 [Chitinophagaceae bacterium]